MCFERAAGQSLVGQNNVWYTKIRSTEFQPSSRSWILTIPGSPLEVTTNQNTLKSSTMAEKNHRMKNKLIISGFFDHARKRRKVTAIAAMRYQVMAQDRFREITNLSKLLN